MFNLLTIDFSRYASIVGYIIPFCACICFLFFLVKNSLASLKVQKLFIYATISVIVLIFSEAIDYYFGITFDKPFFARYLFSFFAYVARPAIAYFICLIPIRNESSKFNKWLFIPLAINIILNFISMFVPILFYFSDDNHFHRVEPLGYTTFIVSGFYLACILIFAFLAARDKKTQEIQICGLIVLMCLLSVLVENEFVDYKGALPAVSIIGIIFYYMFFLVNKYSTDALTGAYLRNCLYIDLNKKESRYFIIFDINGLKKINDEKGHILGDKALTDFSKAVFKYLPRNAKFYRLGGDEFAIIYKTNFENDIYNLLYRIEKDCADLPFGFSYGFEPFTCDKDFDAAYIEADKMLYINKNKYWSVNKK